MSIDATRWVWRQGIKPSGQLVTALRIADLAGPDCSTYAGMDHILEQLPFSRRQLETYMAQLTRDGVLLRYRRKRAGGTRTSDLLVLPVPVEERKYKGDPDYSGVVGRKVEGDSLTAAHCGQPHRSPLRPASPQPTAASLTAAHCATTPQSTAQPPRSIPSRVTLEPSVEPSVEPGSPTSTTAGGGGVLLLPDSGDLEAIAAWLAASVERWPGAWAASVERGSAKLLQLLTDETPAARLAAIEWLAKQAPQWGGGSIVPGPNGIAAARISAATRKPAKRSPLAVLTFEPADPRTSTRVAAEVVRAFDEATAELWLLPLSAVDVGDGITLAGPAHLSGWARDRCGGRLAASLGEPVGFAVGQTAGPALSAFVGQQIEAPS